MDRLNFDINLFLNPSHYQKGLSGCPVAILKLQVTIHQQDQNDPVKAKNDPVNGFVKKAILTHLKHNPKATYAELTEKNGYLIAIIIRHIQELKKLGLIERLGSDKTGNWKINN